MANKLRPPHCIIFHCQKPIYAALLCRTHYEQARKFHTTLPYFSVRCQVPTCNTIFAIGSLNRKQFQLCNMHQTKKKHRFQQMLPTTTASLAQRMSNAGVRNGRWNGGTSEYPDHYYFKQQRLLVLNAAHHLCRCGSRALVVHHLNHNTADHRLENLEALCRKCHRHQHRTTVYRSKFRIKFGKTLQELANEHAVTSGTIKRWFKLYHWLPGQPRPRRTK